MQTPTSDHRTTVFALGRLVYSAAPMRLDLSADPWGVAMLAAATVLALGLVIGLLALIMRTSKRAAGWFCGLGSLAFLVTAAGGTWQRIEAHDAAAKKAAAEAAKPEGKVLQAPPVPVDTAGAAVEAPAGSSGAADDGVTGSAGSDGGEESAGTGDAPANTDDVPADIVGDVPPELDEPPAPTPTPAVAVAPDFPSGKEAGKAEAAKRLRDAKQIVDEDKDCRDPDKLRSTWLSLSTIPPTIMAVQVKAMARKVEACRRRLVGGRQWKLRKDQVAARDAFATTLKQRLAEEKIGLWISVYGADHEKLNAGSKQLDQDRIKKLLDDGLRDELLELGFVQASISDGKNITREDLTPKSVAEMVDDELEPYGLADVLRLGE